MPITKLNAEMVRRVCGDISDSKVLDILASGADLAALEEALAWASGDDETGPDRHLAPHSPAARVFDILAADEDAGED